ncbi:MAG TPA: hypothetical protein PLU22_10120 [Polyangiaceae bacterium]|nr:hypothetical protein [Polyangiaceae bacterium]
MTVFARFAEEFPERRETRFLILVDRAGKEADRLYLDECYCADPECDCGRVLLGVHDRDVETRAMIVYDFVGGADRTPGGENPYLEPGFEQPDRAEQILALVGDSLERDAAYQARLVRHYREMKARTRDPAHPLWPAILRDRREMARLAESLVRSFAPPALAGPSRERRERNRNKRRRKRR